MSPSKASPSPRRQVDLDKVLPSEEELRERFKKERMAKRGSKSPRPPNEASPDMAQPSPGDRYGNYLKKENVFAEARPEKRVHELDRPNQLEKRYERRVLST